MRTIPFVNLKSQHSEIKDELIEAVGRVIDSADFIIGQEVERFEENIARYCTTRYAVGVNSGTDALFLSLKVLDIGAGDEVLTAPNSFLSTASCIVSAGALPVFVDIRKDYTIDPELIEKAITKRTKAIIPVHLTGKPAEMERIMAIASMYKLAVIEDAAQALGAEYRGKKVGSFGDTGCFSLHPLKTLNACGDGGILTTNNEKLYRTLLQLRNIGLKNRNESEIWGYNSRLDSIQAAILNIKLKYLDSWIDARRKNAECYRAKLKNIPGIEYPVEESYEKQVYHTFIIRSSRRDDLLRYLTGKGVETKIHYPIPIHLQKASLSLGYRKGDFPVCEESVRTILSLPIYQGLEEDEIHYISDIIASFKATE